jgi:exosortase
VAARAAVDALQILGVPALVEGNIIHLADARLFVEEACSGLRSLMALLTLGVVFARFFKKRNSDRLILIASTLPIAIFVNAVRVALTGILTHAYGEASAAGFIHDFQGLITFALAFLVLLAEARLLGWLRRRTGAAALPARSAS